VHEAKGLEAPIVWLLDANDTRGKNDGYGVLIDWPTNAARPAHFSLFGTKSTHGKKRQHLFEAEEEYGKREGMNLLYVAITRAKQVLLVSGNGKSVDTEQKKSALSWYDRISQTILPAENSMLQKTASGTVVNQRNTMQIDKALQRALSTGKRAATETIEQRRGTWLHALLQQLTTAGMVADQAYLQVQCGVPAHEMDALWKQAHALLAQPKLQRFFDTRQYQNANNEMPYVNAQGELKRIDRLVEFDSEVWVLDYKTSTSHETAPYRAQMAEYRSAMQSVYAGKKVCCALLFTDGTLCEM
jgi:ATP-dependent helicase/nuclease subunit A